MLASTALLSATPIAAQEASDVTTSVLPNAAPASAEMSDADVGLIEAPEGAASLGVDPAAADHFDANGFGETRQMNFAPMAAPAEGPPVHSPVVVELFTSQGCSSCPVADEMLRHLANRSDVLALSWHVDYWDYLGWADEFGSPTFTGRQKAYARSIGERSVYTPQIMVGGTQTLIHLRPADLMGMIEAQIAQPIVVSVNVKGIGESFQLELTPRAKPQSEIAILLVRYVPERSVTIGGGENMGRKLVYRNVVLAVERLAVWDGKAPLRLKVSAGTSANARFPKDTRHAILAQQIGRHGRATGPIFAAVKLD